MEVNTSYLLKHLVNILEQSFSILREYQDHIQDLLDSRELDPPSKFKSADMEQGPKNLTNSSDSDAFGSRKAFVLDTKQA